jgi:hypothetical protein
MYTRNCPKCQEVITHKHIKSYKRSLKNKSCCYKCSNGKRSTPKRHCLDCGDEITKYGKTKRCKSCAAKESNSRPEEKLKRSKTLTGRVFTQEHKTKISKGLKKYLAPIVEENNKLLDVKKLYYKMVNKITNEQPIHLLDNYDKRGRAGTKGAYHLDHKYSKAMGFKNNVDPELIGNIANLEFIPWEENTKKIEKCSITLKELKLHQTTEFYQGYQETNYINKMNKIFKTENIL